MDRLNHGSVTHRHNGLRLAHAWAVSRYTREPGLYAVRHPHKKGDRQPQKSPEPCLDDAAARTAGAGRRTESARRRGGNGNVRCGEGAMVYVKR